MTAHLDLAVSRNVAWAPTIDLFYPGDQLPPAGASIRMEIVGTNTITTVSGIVTAIA